MVEGHANSTEDYLIEGLSFKLAPGAILQIGGPLHFTRLVMIFTVLLQGLK